MSLSEVSNMLWRERRLLELLVFKLEEEQLVLASGRTRWLSHATREVETILGEINRVELERAMAVAGAIGELGLSDTPSLRELAAIAQTPWDGIFGDHRRALLTLAREIESITKSNGDMLQRGRHVHGHQTVTAWSAQPVTRTQQVQTAHATVGATSSRVDTAKHRNLTNATTQQNLSDVENAGLAQVLLNRQAQETTYQAALAAAAKAIPPSLAAFLQ